MHSNPPWRPIVGRRHSVRKILCGRCGRVREHEVESAPEAFGVRRRSFRCGCGARFTVRVPTDESGGAVIRQEMPANRWVPIVGWCGPTDGRQP